VIHGVRYLVSLFVCCLFGWLVGLLVVWLVSSLVS